MIPMRRFGVGAGGGDHGEAALYRLMAAVKVVRILVSVLVMPLLGLALPGRTVADENSECL